ncbi:MFS transporter [Actinosynnema sp. CA-248983]
MRGKLLRHADFRKLWFGQTVSNFGDAISLIALPTVAILTLDGGALETGLLGAIRFLPFLLIAPVAGRLVDRTSRRTVMIVTDLGRFLVLASIPAAYALGALTLAQLLVVAALHGTLTVFFQVAYQAYLPALVGPDNLVEGNTKLQFSRSAAEVFGAGAAGALIGALGAARAVLADALTYLVSVLALVFLRHREEPATAPEDPQRSAEDDRPEVRAKGWRLLLSFPLLRSLMLTTTTLNLAVAMADALLLVYAYQTLGLSPGEVAVAFGVGSVGFFLGASIARRVAGRFGVGRTLAAATALISLAYFSLPFGTLGAALPILVAARMIVGVANPLYDIHVMTLVQSVTPNHLMGRIGGTALSAVFGSVALGFLVGGVVGQQVGSTAGIVTAGVLCLLATCVVLASPLRSIRSHETAPKLSSTAAA